WAWKARALLEEKNFGPEWMEMVEVWFQCKEKKGFVSPTKGVAAKLRPVQVGAWVQRARTGKPDIKDVEEFAASWTKWWQEINPPWRKGIVPMPCTDGCWSSMDLPGPNGFLNVLICLKWWRERLQEESEGWKEAVGDVKWV
ncbi:hypothetical protein DFH08DRAFT_639345, partial [Mycena albidolilacea]